MNFLLYWQLLTLLLRLQMMIDVLSLETKIFKTQKYFVANPLSASERLFRKITILKLSFFREGWHWRNFRAEGSLKKYWAWFESGLKIRTQGSWLGSANTTSVLCQLREPVLNGEWSALCLFYAFLHLYHSSEMLVALLHFGCFAEDFF